MITSLAYRLAHLRERQWHSKSYVTTDDGDKITYSHRSVAYIRAYEERHVGVIATSNAAVVPTAAKCVRYRQEKSWYPLHFRDVVLLELLDPAHLSLGEGSARLLEG